MTTQLVAAAGARRVALIGFGFGGRVFHAPLIATTPGLTLSFVVTSDADRRAAATAGHPGCEVLSRVEDLWARADEVDLIVISTPNATHVPLALQAVRLGLPVVVDKPLAPSVAAGEAIIEEAERLTVPLTVYQNRRWDSDFLTLQHLIDGNRLGRVHRLESRFERWSPLTGTGWKESDNPDDGGGVVLDLGAHLIDQSLITFGPVATVYAEVAALRGGAAVADEAFLALRHLSGTISHLWMSHLAADRGPRLRALGDRGAFTVWGMDPQEAALIAGQRPGGPDWGVSPVERVATLSDGDRVTDIELLPGSYPTFYIDLERSLRDGANALPCHPRDSLAVLEIVAAAMRSSTAGQVVPMPVTR